MFALCQVAVRMAGIESGTLGATLVAVGAEVHYLQLPPQQLQQALREP